MAGTEGTRNMASSLVGLRLLGLRLMSPGEPVMLMGPKDMADAEERSSFDFVNAEDTSFELRAMALTLLVGDMPPGEPGEPFGGMELVDMERSMATGRWWGAGPFQFAASDDAADGHFGVL